MEIKEFNYNDIPKYATITVVASRRSGKSVLVRDILYKEFLRRRKIKNLIIVSPTLHNQDYAFVDNQYKFIDFDQNFINDILERQQELISTDPKGEHDLVMVLDDIVKSTDMKTRDILSRLYTLSRHYRLFIILVSQSMRHELTPIIKFNSDLVILFKTKNLDNKIDIRDHWLGFSDKDDRDRALGLIDKIAQGYRAMVIDCTSHSNKPEEIITWVKVDVEHSVPKKFYFH